MNLPAVDALFDTFHTISGMKIVLYDSQFHYIAGNQGQDNDYCNLIHKSKKCLDICLQSDIDALRLVEKTGKPHLYTCPFGLFEAVVPVLEKNEVIAYLFIGPAIEKGNGRDSVPIKAATTYSEEFQIETLRKLVSKLSHYTRKELEAYCHVLSVFGQHLERTNSLPVNRQSIGQLTKNYIRNNLHKKITLAELSMNLHCSTVTLTENFRKEFGYTIMQYVTKKRMDLAESMLEESYASITEIAESCGFSDVEYFSKCFKTYHGISPSIWRKTHTGGQA